MKQRSTILVGVICLGLAGCSSQPVGDPSYVEHANHSAGAKKRGIIGSVSIGVVIDESGAIADAKILESSNTELNEAAIAAVRQWRFTGAKKDGKPIRVYYTIPIVFQIP